MTLITAGYLPNTAIPEDYLTVDYIPEYGAAPAASTYVGRPSSGLRVVWRKIRPEMMDDPEVLKLLINLLEVA